MERISRERRLTYVLAGSLAVVVAVVALLVLTYPDGTDDLADATGGQPINTGVTGTGPADGALRSGALFSVPTEGTDANSFCRSYVYKRCNELAIGPTDCSGIAETAAGVPRNLGIGGCRSMVDDIIARVAGITEEEVSGAAPAVRQDVDAGVGDEGPVADEDGRVDEGGGGSGAGDGDGQPVQVAVRSAGGADPAAAAAAMERMRQLETEIAYARNNFVGSNIGVQSRLDEMRAIAEEAGTPEAMAAYNATLTKLGWGSPPAGGGYGVSSGGGASVAPSGPGGATGVSEPVVTAPAASNQAQVVTETSSPAAVVEVGAQSF